MQMLPVALLLVQAELVVVETWLLQSFPEKLQVAETLVPQLLAEVPVQELVLQVSAVASAPTVAWCLLSLSLFLLVKVTN